MTGRNDYVDGIWTYSMDKIHNGMQDCYASLCKDVKEKYGAENYYLRHSAFSNDAWVILHLTKTESFWFLQNMEKIQ